MAGQGQKSPVELALFARKHRIYNRFQIVVDDLPRHAAKERKGPVVGIKNHLLRLARIGHNEHLTAVSQPEMRQLDRRRGSAHHDMLVAPVKLRHIAGRKEQRHKGLRARGPTRFNLPLPHMTLNAVISTGISLGLKTLKQPSCCPPPRFGQKSITAQPLIKTDAPRPKLGPGLRLALVNRFRPILQIFANPSAIARTNGALPHSATVATTAPGH